MSEDRTPPQLSAPQRLAQLAARNRGQILSVAVHGVLLLLLVGGIVRAPQVVPYRLPGTAKGDAMLTYYMPGSFHPLKAQNTSKSAEKPKPATQKSPTLKPPPVEPAHETQAKAGIGASAESGLGQGDITIALQSFFPYPKPDLSALPHGTKGDVILNAVIDAQGHISELTLLKGLGTPVDQTVMATVQQWRYTPAMRNGVPIVSEQELHFHYERG